jgi:hypothetical protein
MLLAEGRNRFWSLVLHQGKHVHIRGDLLYERWSRFQDWWWEPIYIFIMRLSIRCRHSCSSIDGG